MLVAASLFAHMPASIVIARHPLSQSRTPSSASKPRGRNTREPGCVRLRPAHWAQRPSPRSHASPCTPIASLSLKPTRPPARNAPTDAAGRPRRALTDGASHPVYTCTPKGRPLPQQPAASFATVLGLNVGADRCRGRRPVCGGCDAGLEMVARTVTTGGGRIALGLGLGGDTAHVNTRTLWHAPNGHSRSPVLLDRAAPSHQWGHST